MTFYNYPHSIRDKLLFMSDYSNGVYLNNATWKDTQKCAFNDMAKTIAYYYEGSRNGEYCTGYTGYTNITCTTA